MCKNPKPIDLVSDFIMRIEPTLNFLHASYTTQFESLSDNLLIRSLK
jgi:hypothetical protein